MNHNSFNNDKSLAISALHRFKRHLMDSSANYITVSNESIQKLNDLKFKISQNESPESQPRRATEKNEQIKSLNNLIETDIRLIDNDSLRDTAVLGDGNLDANIMFIGEAPGYEEEVQKTPFVGPSGQLLNKIITAMGINRKDVYISNILKFRPKIGDGTQGNSNRKPSLEEIKSSINYLLEEIKIIKPKVIIILGGTAMEGLLGLNDPISKVRGIIHSLEGAQAIATYHPSFLLRSKNEISDKRKVWEDMLLAMELLEIGISDKQRAYFS
jgi:DNA polymerase